MRKIRALTILIVSLPLLFSSVSTAQAACNTYDNGLGGQSGTCNGERVNTYGNGLGGVSGTGIGGVPGITKSTKKCVSSFTKKC